MRVVEVFRRLLRNSDALPDIRLGISNQSELLNRKLSEVIEANDALQDCINKLKDRIEQLIDVQKAQLVMQRDQADAADVLADKIVQLANLTSRT